MVSFFHDKWQSGTAVQYTPSGSWLSMAKSRCWKWLRERFTRFHTNLLCTSLRWPHFLKRVASIGGIDPMDRCYFNEKLQRTLYKESRSSAANSEIYPRSIFAAVWFYLEHTSSLWEWDIINELNYIWGCWLRTLVLWSPSCGPEAWSRGTRK